MEVTHIYQDVRELVIDHDLHRIFGTLFFAFMTTLMFSTGYGYIYPTNVISDTVITSFSETSHPDMFTVDMWLYLTLHNFWIGVGIMFGFFVTAKICRYLAILPGLFLLLQAVGTGCVLGTYAVQHGIVFVIVCIVCHGVIEIPTIILSGAFGYYLAGKSVGIKKSIRLGIYCMGILFICFLVSGFIESFITPALALIVSGF